MKLRNILITAFIFTISFSNIFAQYDTVSVNIEPASGGTVIGDGAYFSTSLVTLEAKTNTGYNFVSWTENGSKVSEDSVYKFIITGNRSLVANFELKSYTIETTSLPLDGGVLNGSGTYIHGTNVILEAIPNVGYSFINWTENNIEVSSDSLINFTAASNRNLIANFELKSYLVSASVEPTESGTISGTGSYSHGDNVILEAIPNSEYIFVNWTENNIEVSVDSLINFTATSDRNLIANFELISYLVSASVEPTESGTVTGAGTYVSGTNVILEALPNTGYSFVNWTEDELELSTDSVLTFNAETNRNIVANFTKSNYNVITNPLPSVGGITSGSGNYIHGDLVTVIATPASGYFFQHWTENDTVASTDSVYSFTISNHRNLTAVFAEKQYIVKTIINPALSGTVKGDSTYTNRSLVKLVASSNTGWEFSGWTENNNLVAVDSNYSFIIFEDKNFTANFTKLVYNITLSSLPDIGGTVYGEGNYAYDSLVTVVATPSPGYYFSNWTKNDSIISVDSSFSFNVNGSLNLVANFSKKSFPIRTISNPLNAGITMGDSLYTFGDSLNICAIAESDSGWEFSHWSENGTQISSDSIFTIIADTNRTITANFNLKSYSVNLISYPDNAGIVDGLGTYTHGDSVSIKAVPQDGWLFANWTEGENSISDQPNVKFRIDDNKVLIANFAHELYSINTTAAPSEAGYVSGSGTFYYDQAANLTPVANPGWEFLNWTENGTEISSDSILSINVTENKNLIANFNLVNYTINCSAEPSEAGYVSGSGTFYYDQTANLTPVANPGWEFFCWTENGDTISTLSEYNFNVKDNRNIIANFRLVTSIDNNNPKDFIPSEFYLSNAYPNPFNPSTTIKFGLPASSIVKIIISNINGEIVKVLLDNKSLEAGNYSEQFNADNLSSGIYFYYISAQARNNENSFRKVGKMILLK